MGELDPPFGVGPEVGVHRILQIIESLEFTVVNGKCYFQEVLYKLMNRAYGAELKLERLVEKVSKATNDKAVRRRLSKIEANAKGEDSAIKIDPYDTRSCQIITSSRLHISALKIQALVRHKILGIGLGSVYIGFNLRDAVSALAEENNLKAVTAAIGKVAKRPRKRSSIRLNQLPKAVAAAHAADDAPGDQNGAPFSAASRRRSKSNSRMVV